MSSASIQANSKNLLTECSKQKPNIKTLQSLIQKGIDPSITDNGGHTPIMLHMIKAKIPDPNVITILHDANISIHTKNEEKNNMTAILYAAKNVKSSRAVFETFFSLGASVYDKVMTHEYDQNPTNILETMQDTIRRNYNARVSYLDLQLYLDHILENHNKDKTKINSLFLHEALEKYIKSVNHPETSEISKIIQSYSHIPGIYPGNQDVSGTNPEEMMSEVKLVSPLLFDCLNVIFIAASKRCSIEVFDELIKYGREMATRFGCDIMEILSGHYHMDLDYHPKYYDFILNADNETIPMYKNRDVLSLYVNSNYKLDFKNDFSYDTFEYLVVLLKRDYRLYTDPKVYGILTYAEHPLMYIIHTYFEDKDMLLKIIDIFIKAGTNMNMSDTYQNTLISKYISKCGRDPRVVIALLKGGLDLNCRQASDQETPLMDFVKYQSFDTMYTIVFDYNPDWYAVDSDNRSVLDHYLNSRVLHKREISSEVFTHLLSIIDFSKFTTVSEYPLLWTYCGLRELDMNVIDKLLALKRDVNYASKYWGNCLARHLAQTSNPDINIIKKFAEVGVDFNAKVESDGMSIFMIATRSGFSTEVLQTLIDCGARVNDVDSKGNTPFHHLCEFASQSKYYSDDDDSDDEDDLATKQSLHLDEDDKFKFLIQLFDQSPVNGTDIRKSYENEGENDNQAEDDGSKRESTVGNDNPNAITVVGNELLAYCAITKPSLEIVKLLLNEKSLSVNHTNSSNSFNPLMCLIFSDDPDPQIITALVKANLNINYKKKEQKDRTALFYACAMRHSLEFIKTLVDNGADIKNIDNTGSSPLAVYEKPPFTSKRSKHTKMTNRCKPICRETKLYLETL